MITMLLRLDPAFKGMWALAAFGVGGGFLLRGVSMRLSGVPGSYSGEEGGWLVFTLALAMLSALLVMLGNSFTTRAPRLLAALPISTRVLWWVRMFSILFSGTAPILVATAIVAVGRADAPYFAAYALVQGLKAAAGLVLLAFLLHLPSPWLARIEPSIGYIAYAAILSAVMIVCVALTPAAPAVIAVLLMVALGAAVFTVRSLPRTFLLAPTDLGPAAAPAAAAAESSVAGVAGHAVRPAGGTDVVLPPRNDQWLLHSTLFRMLVLDWRFAVFSFLTLAYTFLLGNAWEEGHTPVINIMFITVWSLACCMWMVSRLTRVDHLPISRRLLFPYFFIPPTLPILIGLLAGSIFFQGSERIDCRVCYGEGGVAVVAEFWEVAWDGVPPEVTAPWGESYQPKPVRLLPVGAPAVYQPYAAGPDHSARFHAYQANRAIATIYGQPLYSDEEITSGSTPLERMVAKGLDDQEPFSVEELVGSTSSLRLRTWQVGGTVIAWAWAFLAMLGLLQYRPGAPRSLAKFLFFTLLIGWIGVVLAYMFADMAQYASPAAAGRLPLILFRHLAQSLNLGPLAAWGGITLTALLIGTMLCQTFRTIEAPPRPGKPVRWE